MVRPFTEADLLIATRNQGKIKEISTLLGNFPVNLHSTAHLDVPDPEETGTTFKENAILKATYYGKEANMAALADDSGLAVDALDGQPGIYSARWAGEEGDFSKAMARIKNELEGKVNEGDPIHASFICAMALWWPDGHVESFQGTIEGTLTFPPRGEKGFGYDPIFIPNGYTDTFAEFTPEAKNALSHRARALKQVVDAYFTKAA